MAEPLACAPSALHAALGLCEDNKPSSHGESVSKMLWLPLQSGSWVIGLQSRLQRRELGTPKWRRISSRSRASESGEGLCPGREVAVLLRSHLGPVVGLYPRPPPLPPHLQRLPFFSSEDLKALISASSSHTRGPHLSLAPFYRWEKGGGLGFRAGPQGSPSKLMAAGAALALNIGRLSPGRASGLSERQSSPMDPDTDSV